MAGAETGSGDGGQVPVFGELGEDDPERLGGYHLVARLGAGGMGEVYLAYTLAGRPVAIKAIRPELADSPEFRRRFRREVAAAQRVHGLYTAPVIDSEIEGPTLWLATAFVPGPTLTAAVSRHGPLPVSTVLLLVAGVAEALQAVHGEGIVHGDLKASNVLLAADGPRVIDFGISRSADATGRTTTETGIAAGTPSFMSPEQARNRGIGPATDIFSLGQVVAYAARGTTAFGSGPAFSVLYRIVYEEPDLTGVPEALLPLLHGCLAKEPDERPSLAEVIDLCRAASDDGMLRRSGNWLPEAVAGEITRHQDADPTSTEHEAEAGHEERAKVANAQAETLTDGVRDANSGAGGLRSAAASPPSSRRLGEGGEGPTLVNGEGPTLKDPSAHGNLQDPAVHGNLQDPSTHGRKPRRARRRIRIALSTALAAVLVWAGALIVSAVNTQSQGGSSGERSEGDTKPTNQVSPTPSRSADASPSEGGDNEPTQNGPSEAKPSGTGGSGTAGKTPFVDSSLRLSDHFDRCIDVDGNRRVEGSMIQLWNCNPDTAGQSWTLRADGTMRAYGDMCMNVAGPLEERGKLQLAKCSAGRGQKWEYTARKELRIKGKTHPRLCLDDPRGELGDGTRLQLYRCLGGVFSQQWYIFDE